VTKSLLITQIDPQFFNIWNCNTQYSINITDKPTTTTTSRPLLPPSWPLQAPKAPIPPVRCQHVRRRTVSPPLRRVTPSAPCHASLHKSIKYPLIHPSCYQKFLRKCFISLSSSWQLYRRGQTWRSTNAPHIKSAKWKCYSLVLQRPSLDNKCLWWKEQKI
jgi:hypothetical protein